MVNIGSQFLLYWSHVFFLNTTDKMLIIFIMSCKEFSVLCSADVVNILKICHNSNTLVLSRWFPNNLQPAKFWLFLIPFLNLGTLFHMTKEDWSIYIRGIIVRKYGEDLVWNCKNINRKECGSMKKSQFYVLLCCSSIIFNVVYIYCHVSQLVANHSFTKL